MQEFGIWTENDGGFTETQLYSREAAEHRLAEIIAEGESPEEVVELREDLRIEEICEDHEGQPRHGCEDCNEEYVEINDELDAED
ncbi:hypothetical protein [Nonomuraea typhae]|uniref:Uncharacterized protein n=1 Tax=Nonomuraea typhae TaxID=2603600 RepID=A0ABW7YN96_9ACTN